MDEEKHGAPFFAVIKKQSLQKAEWHAPTTGVVLKVACCNIEPACV